MGFLDSFLAFMNGMVAGIILFIQGGLKYSLCNLLKLSKFASKLRAKPIHSTQALSTASPKSSKMRALLLSTKAIVLLNRHSDSLDWSRVHGISPVRDLLKFQKINSAL